MVFWRKKNNQGEQERDERNDRMIHHPADPDLELPTEYDAEISPELKHELEETEREVLEEINITPVPVHTFTGDAQEHEDLIDHTEEGGWLSRLTFGLSKSSGRLTKGITDILTKSKLDEAALDRLEELLIEADLGPKTAARIVREFSQDRFGKDVHDQEIRETLAGLMAKALTPVAKGLRIEKPASGPFVILVCGVNGVGKTTTIGKLAHKFIHDDKRKVMLAAGDTFRAAAVEQLQEWARRSGALFHAKDLGADAAALAFEAYEKAKAENVDVLLIDTAGRLHNKANLMAELEKIVRVLKKQDESLPHACLLVLDATTGQNAFAQLETFKQMVNVTGLVLTKLDGSAKGGVMVGLADQFGMPVHLIGIGEGIEDLQPFKAHEYARSLMGLS